MEEFNMTGMNDGTVKIIKSINDSMTKLEIAQIFNQNAIDLIDIVGDVTKRLGLENEYKILSYKSLLLNVQKINIMFPINNFYKSVSPFTSKIYEGDVEYFLLMDIPDVKTNNIMIQSESFKKLWKNENMTKEEREKIIDSIILLTSYSHAYFL